MACNVNEGMAHVTHTVSTSEQGVVMAHNNNKAGAMGRRDLMKAGIGLALMSKIATARSTQRSSEGDICALSAKALSSTIAAREVSCVEVMQAYLDRISRLNPTFNPMVSLADPEHCIAAAAQADRDLARGLYRGWMHGFPMAIKDLADAEGFVTAKGSPLYKDNVAASDSIHVSRMKAAGGIVIGKTNVPEFGLGSNTYNPVFGATGSAWDATRTAGGSSGGAAASLALHMQPLADGSDLMGSLRNPAAFNNVIGFRPTPGRVPIYGLFIEDLPCNGPMGRTVEDTAMLLSTIAGYHPSAPTTIPEDPAIFASPLARDFKGTRIGWLGDMGGHLPMEAGVLELCERALGSFEDIGCSVDSARIDFSADQLWQIWMVYRHWIVSALHRADYDDPERRQLLKPECVWEVEGGLSLSGQDVFSASAGRAGFYAALLRAFERFDYLVLPSAQVFPFPKDIPWPKAIAGKSMDTYHRWMEVVVPGTLSGCPVAAVPAGFSDTGLPMGLQIIGPRYRDFATLQLAYAYEQASRWNLDHRPPVFNA